MTKIRNNWTKEEIREIYDMPIMELIYRASTVHREFNDPQEVQVCTLLSVKTGGCPEDCAYCPQAARYHTDVKVKRLLPVNQVIQSAKEAKEAGSTRFCMGAAWRSPKDRDMPAVLAMVKGVKDLGLETCMTLGMLKQDQAKALGEAGLDYYNHNLDTSPEYYRDIITTRTYQDRLDTLQQVRDAGINVCAGGIVGMGESSADRVGFLQQLANLPEHPQSVPINQLVRVEGTPLANSDDFDSFDFIRTLAVARIMMPESHVRLSAGREEMNQEMQALAFFVGANSIFYGEKLLTTPNPQANEDMRLFDKLGIHPEVPSAAADRHSSSLEKSADAMGAMSKSGHAVQPLFYDAAAAQAQQ